MLVYVKLNTGINRDVTEDIERGAQIFETPFQNTGHNNSLLVPFA